MRGKSEKTSGELVPAPWAGAPNTGSRVSVEEVAAPLEKEEKETTSSVEHRR
jgi:hypothetical protein